jgi:acetyl-CoA C-acetyltransferase
VVGGNRIPFARSNSVYSHASNQDLLTAALDGLVERFALEGETLGEVAGGAVLKHSRDRDLTPRERAQHPPRAPETPALRRPAGLRAPGWRTTILVANQDRPGQIDSCIGLRAPTPPRTAPIALNESLREDPARRQPPRSNDGQASAARPVLCRPGHVVPSIPRNEEPAHGLLDGRALRR